MLKEIDNHAVENREIREMIQVGEIAIAVNSMGIGWIYNRYTLQVSIVNKSAKEMIRSIFLNYANQSLFIVSIKQVFQVSRMKCRSIPLEDLKSGDRLKLKGRKIFEQFVLQYPDFIEFDDLNGKIVTRHSREMAYRIWNISNYDLCYVLKHEFLHEFKICNGIMLLIFD